MKRLSYIVIVASERRRVKHSERCNIDEYYPTIME